MYPSRILVTLTAAIVIAVRIIRFYQRFCKVPQGRRPSADGPWCASGRPWRARGRQTRVGGRSSSAVLGWPCLRPIYVARIIAGGLFQQNLIMSAGEQWDNMVFGAARTHGSTA